jgi:CheY-like chemotaxis protein
MIPGCHDCRLLLAEDNAELRDFAARVLDQAGFDVVAAADGAEALERFESQGPFDLLLLDQDMPRLKGREVLTAIRSRGSRVPALFWSGAALDFNDSERDALSITGVLHKPLSLADLVRAVRAALTIPAFAA